MPDWPPLRDYSHSRAVVMGTWAYAHLAAVPAAANSLERMVSLLEGPLCGWPKDRIVRLTNERSPGDLPDKLITAFEDISDIALFYYVGHGQIDRDDQLCLALADSRTESNRRAATSLPFQAVRQALLDSSAATKIVVLDCCFAGLASQPPNTLAGLAGDVLDMTAGVGAYTMAASGAYTTAWYETGSGVVRPQTYFTKYLVDIVEAGIPGEPPGLRLHPLFTQVRDNLARDHRPIPVERNGDGARDFVLAHNAAPVQTYRVADTEVRELMRRLAETEAARTREQAEAAAQAQLMREEAAELARELERLKDEAHRSSSMDTGQQQKLKDAIQETGRKLEKTQAAQASAAGQANITPRPLAAGGRRTASINVVPLVPDRPRGATRAGRDQPLPDPAGTVVSRPEDRSRERSGWRDRIRGNLVEIAALVLLGLGGLLLPFPFWPVGAVVARFSPHWRRRGWGIAMVTPLVLALAGTMAVAVLSHGDNFWNSFGHAIEHDDSIFIRAGAVVSAGYLVWRAWPNAWRKILRNR